MHETHCHDAAGLDGARLVNDFRTVLHAWAARQLETRSDHNGAFEIESVRLNSVHGYSVSSDYIEVLIMFRHTGCALRNWDGGPCPTKGSWFMPDTTDTVTMINELLALGDES